MGRSLHAPRGDVSPCHVCAGVGAQHLGLPALSELAMPERKMLRNHSREYWYMGSTLARSDTQKKRIWVRTATGMYSMRVRSMSFSVCSAILTLAWRHRR